VRNIYIYKKVFIIKKEIKNKNIPIKKLKIKIFLLM